MAISLPIEVGAGGLGDLAAGATGIGATAGPKSAVPLIGAQEMLAQTRSVTSGAQTAADAGSFRSRWQSMLASMASGKTADELTETEDATLEGNPAAGGAMGTNAGLARAALDSLLPTANDAAQTKAAQSAALASRIATPAANSNRTLDTGESAPQESAGSEGASAASTNKGADKKQTEHHKKGEHTQTAQNAASLTASVDASAVAMQAVAANRLSERAASMQSNSSDSGLGSGGVHPVTGAGDLSVSGQGAASGMRSVSHPETSAHHDAQTDVQGDGSGAAASTQHLDAGLDGGTVSHEGISEGANVHSLAAGAQASPAGTDAAHLSLQQSNASVSGAQTSANGLPADATHADASSPQPGAGSADNNTAASHTPAQANSRSVRVTSGGEGGAGLAQVAGAASPTAGDPALLAHGPAGTHDAAQGAVAATGGATGASAGTGSRETFAALDTQPGTGTPSWIHAGAQRAEAGFQDPVLGWVGVRADLTGGAVHAALVPGSDQASQMLSGHMAGLNAHLAAEHIQVASLNMAAATGNGAGNAGQGGMGAMQQGAGQGQGQGQGQNGYQSGPGSMDSGFGNPVGAATRGELRESAAAATSMPRAWNGGAGSGTYISVVA